MMTKHKTIATALLLVACGGGEFSSSDGSDGGSYATAGTYQNEAGSPPTGGFPVTGGSPTGGSTGGITSTGGISTGGIQATGGAPTGGSPTGGSPPTGITCGSTTCEEGISCCEPMTSDPPYCIPDPNPSHFCARGWYGWGAVLECTSRDDCAEGEHCCVYKTEINGPGTLTITSSRCGTCADGEGAMWTCVTSSDCAPGRWCKNTTEVFFDTCSF